MGFEDDLNVLGDSWGDTERAFKTLSSGKNMTENKFGEDKNYELIEY